MKTTRKNRSHPARTVDILAPKDSTRMRPEWQKYERRLLALRERLVTQCNEKRREARNGVHLDQLHPADSATEQFDEDLAFTLLSAEQDALYEIDQALHRLREGTYGICEMTGRRIPATRLQVVPWTRFRADVERNLENEHALSPPRLNARGELRPVPSTGEETEEDGAEPEP